MKSFWKNWRASASDVAWAVVLVTVTTLFLASTCTAKADAEPLPEVTGVCAPEVVEDRRVVLSHEGVAGVWFHRDIVLCTASRLRLLPLFADRVRLLEQRLTISDERHALMARQVALAEEGEQEAVGALEVSVGLARQAESRAARERLLRWLWASLGVVITGAVFALSVWGYHRLDLDEATP